MPPALLDTLQPFAISLLIGLAAGIERERSQPDGDIVMGMRTFALIAVLGTVVAEINKAPLTLAVALFVVTLIVAGYWRSTGVKPDGAMAAPSVEKPADMGLTSEFAACMVFSLGFLTKQDPLLSVILGILLVVILYFRRRLHWFARDVLRPDEITSAILLATFVFIVIPFLPDRTIDPLRLVNPRKLAQVLALIAGVEFCGYAAQRIAGARIGLLIAGLLGGLASSTAVFLTMSKAAKEHPEQLRAIAGASMLATMSPLLLYVTILSATSPSLMTTAGVPVIASAIGAGLLGFILGKGTAVPFSSREEGHANPLDLRGIAKLGAFIFGLLIAAAVAQRYIGAQAVGLVSFVGGLFELHGVTLANATMHAAGSISDHGATNALLSAVLASFLSKVGICWVLAPGRFAGLMTALLAGVVGFGAATHVLLR